MSVFEFQDYKKYLEKRMPTHGTSRGIRARLAQRLGCQSAHISQVLKGYGHFSLEHTAIISEFLEHDEQESEFLLLLVQSARAGNRPLATIYERSMKNLLSRRQRVQLDETKQITSDPYKLAIYYSTWTISAIHVILMAAPSTREELAARLGISRTAIVRSVQHLINLNLVQDVKGGKLKCTPARWHLPPTSEWIAHHHINWRLNVIRHLEQEDGRENFHYSGPIATSSRGVRAIRKIITDGIQNMEPIIAEPGEEEAFAVCIDFFRI